MFKYNYTGTLAGNKFLEVNLFEVDCITQSDASLSLVDSIVGDELKEVDLELSKRPSPTRSITPTSTAPPLSLTFASV